MSRKSLTRGKEDVVKKQYVIYQIAIEGETWEAEVFADSFGDALRKEVSDWDGRFKAVEITSPGLYSETDAWQAMHYQGNFKPTTHDWICSGCRREFRVFNHPHDAPYKMPEPVKSD